MRTVEEIERAIATLAPEQVQELCLWLERCYAWPIDARVQADLADGRLDKPIQRALDDEKMAAFGRSNRPTQHRAASDFVEGRIGPATFASGLKRIKSVCLGNVKAMSWRVKPKRVR